MSQNDIVDRVLSRLEDRNQINEDVLIEGVIELLEESGVDLENISEEQLDEIFGRIGGAIRRTFVGMNDDEFARATKSAGVRRKMRARQAERAKKAAAAAAAPAQPSKFVPQNRDARLKKRKEILNTRRAGRIAQRASDREDDEKSGRLVHPYESTNYRDMILQKLADILIEAKLG